jgi:hypothetical protein
MCQILKTPNKLAIFRKQWCVTASAGKGKIQVLNIALAKQEFKRERNSCRGRMETNPPHYPYHKKKMPYGSATFCIAL